MKLASGILESVAVVCVLLVFAGADSLVNLVLR